jgi:hypothetical protein
LAQIKSIAIGLITVITLIFTDIDIDTHPTFLGREALFAGYDGHYTVYGKVGFFAVHIH